MPSSAAETGFFISQSPLLKIRQFFAFDGTEKQFTGGGELRDHSRRLRHFVAPAICYVSLILRNAPNSAPGLFPGTSDVDRPRHSSRVGSCMSSRRTLEANFQGAQIGTAQ